VVGDMAIYSTGDGIRPQAQSADPQWNRDAEEHFALKARDRFGRARIHFVKVALTPILFT
jgi:hypothetical protein